MVGAVAAIPVRVLVADVVVVGTGSGADVCATTDTRSAPKTYTKRGSVDIAIADVPDHQPSSGANGDFIPLEWFAKPSL